MTQEFPFHNEPASRFFGRSAELSTQLWADLEILHPGDPKAQLQSWIDRTTEHIRTGDIVPNTAEFERDDEAQNVYHEAMTGLCRRAGLSEPDIAAELLILMCEGAKATRQYEDSEEPGDRFRRAAEATVARLSPRKHDQAMPHTKSRR